MTISADQISNGYISVKGIREGGNRRILTPTVVNAFEGLYAVPGELFRVYDQAGCGDLVSVNYELVGDCGEQTLFRQVNSPAGQIRAEAELPRVTLPGSVSVPPSHRGISLC